MLLRDTTLCVLWFCFRFTDVAAQNLESAIKERDIKLATSAGSQGDLRAALMVKDRVLEDRDKVGYTLDPHATKNCDTDKSANS